MIKANRRQYIYTRLYCHDTITCILSARVHAQFSVTSYPWFATMNERSVTTDFGKLSSIN